MSGFYTHIERDTVNNGAFRNVIFTGKNCQLVLMTLLPKEDIGMEIHQENDQFFRFESGEGRVLMDGQEYLVRDGDAIVIPAGTEHNIINTSDTESLKMYTIYSPAHHPDKTIHLTKADALAAEHD